MRYGIGATQAAVNELARDTGLTSTYEIGAGPTPDDVAWVLSNRDVLWNEEGAAWMMVYLTELAHHLGRSGRVGQDARRILGRITDDHLPDDHRPPEEQAFTDSQSPLVRLRVGAPPPWSKEPSGP